MLLEENLLTDLTEHLFKTFLSGVFKVFIEPFSVIEGLEGLEQVLTVMTRKFIKGVVMFVASQDDHGLEQFLAFVFSGGTDFRQKLTWGHLRVMGVLLQSLDQSLFFDRIVDKILIHFFDGNGLFFHNILDGVVNCVGSSNSFERHSNFCDLASSLVRGLSVIIFHQESPNLLTVLFAIDSKRCGKFEFFRCTITNHSENQVEEGLLNLFNITFVSFLNTHQRDERSCHVRKLGDVLVGNEFNGIFQ
mmetsp:Transcript_57606/g.65724  ORF Transcript_57606/g.65724 Transcript_57606/m.65724 type:complete len:247 (+) Transcript_57606:260-1000(+)